MERMRVKTNGTHLKERAVRLLSEARDLGKDGLARGKTLVGRIRLPAALAAGLFLAGLLAGLSWRRRA